METSRLHTLEEAFALKTAPELVAGGAEPEHAAIFAVWERIDWRLRSVGFEGLTPGERLLHVIFFVVDSDIENGGLHQFFTNSSGDFAEEAKAGMRKIGATSTASVLEEASNKYFGGSVPEDRDTRDDILTALEEAQGEALWDDIDDLSRRYHRSTPGLHTALLEWIRTNRHDFAVPSDEQVRDENEKRAAVEAKKRAKRGKKTKTARYRKKS